MPLTMTLDSRDVLEMATTTGEVVGADLASLEQQLRQQEQAGEVLQTTGLVAVRSPVANGRGHWDFIRISDDLILTIVDVIYDEDTWIRVPGEGLFKVRVLLSGRLSSRSGAVLLEGSGAYLVAYPGLVSDGYFVKAKTQTKLLILHCRKELLTHRLGIPLDGVPAPLSQLFGRPAQNHAGVGIRLGSEVLRAANDIIRAPAQFPRHLRRAYIESRCHDIVCSVLRQLGEPGLQVPAGMKLTQRDINRVYEARDILQDRYSAPPGLRELARTVGLNQTKLKAAFKIIFGVTAYDFVRKCRMEAAAELLLTTDLSIAEIAYEVGFEYPGNFTHAYSRFFGHLPRDVKRPTPS